jgi:hypothetical protein
MKSKVKKLTLNRESLRLLGRSDLEAVAGQAPRPTNPHDETCVTCNTCFGTCTC